MIDKSAKNAGSIDVAMRLALRLAAPGVALVLIGAGAEAAEVKFPKDHPVIVMDVPDGWSVDMSPIGLDIRSPEKNSIIVAQVVGHEKKKVEAWTRQAGETLKAFGIAFDPNPKPLPPPPKPAAPVITAPSTFSKSPDAFTFAGPPSLASPETPNAADALAAGPTSLQSLTGIDTTVKPKENLPFRSVKYLGTSVAGKHVDAELVIYDLPDKRLFVMVQESGPDDNRSVAIAKSVRSVKPDHN